VLRSFAATGRPPAAATLEAAAAQFGLTAGLALAELDAADVLGLDPDGGIRMCYPFSGVPTPHAVAIEAGPHVHAMCAIDALGIPPMLGADAVISSADPVTGAPVTITFDAGKATWSPDTAVVFVGRRDGDGPAELVTCGCLNFFDSAASAMLWADQRPDVTGSVLDHARAEALATETFGSLLRAGS
jgi:Alkylmercury lyase